MACCTITNTASFGTVMLLSPGEALLAAWCATALILFATALLVGRSSRELARLRWLLVPAGAGVLLALILAANDWGQHEATEAARAFGDAVDTGVGWYVALFVVVSILTGVQYSLRRRPGSITDPLPVVVAGLLLFLITAGARLMSDREQLQLRVPIEDIPALQEITAAHLRDKSFDRPRVRQEAARCDGEIVNRYAIRPLRAGEPVPKDALSGTADAGCPTVTPTVTPTVNGTASAAPTTTPTPTWRFVLVALPSSAVVPADVLRPGDEVLVFAVRAVASETAAATAIAAPTNGSTPTTSLTVTATPVVCAQGLIAGRSGQAEPEPNRVTVVSVQGSGKDAVVTLRIPVTAQSVLITCLRDATIVVTQPEK